MNTKDFRKLLKTLSVGDVLEVSSPLPTLERVSGEQFAWCLFAKHQLSKRVCIYIFNLSWHTVRVGMVTVRDNGQWLEMTHKNETVFPIELEESLFS